MSRHYYYISWAKIEDANFEDENKKNYSFSLYWCGQETHENHLSSSSFLQSNYTRDMDPKERPKSLPKDRKNDANGMRLEINECKFHSIYPTFTLHSFSAGKHLVAQSASRGQIGRAKWERGPLKLDSFRRSGSLMSLASLQAGTLRVIRGWHSYIDESRRRALLVHQARSPQCSYLSPIIERITVKNFLQDNLCSDSPASIHLSRRCLGCSKKCPHVALVPRVDLAGNRVKIWVEDRPR